LPSEKTTSRPPCTSFFSTAAISPSGGDTADHQHCRKFGKHIQKRQLDIPEYAASFVDYKALKKV
jgi:CDK inhibitor PHO81